METETIEVVKVKCPFCNTESIADGNYCCECGGELKKLDYEKMLGVEITAEDIKDYVIIGRVRKTIRIGEHVTVGIQTLSSGEWKTSNHAADALLAAAGHLTTHTIEMNQRMAAYGLFMIAGNEKIGELTKEQRYDHVQTMSSDFIEIIASKISLLHKIMMAKIQEGQVSNF